MALPDENFVEETKIEWTAPTADGGYIFPYMRAREYHWNSCGNFMYNTMFGFVFAIFPTEQALKRTFTEEGVRR